MQHRIFSKRVSRRHLIAGAVAGLCTVVAPGLVPGVMRIAAAQSWRTGNPFSLGVA
jgi:hypothetical protein